MTEELETQEQEIQETLQDDEKLVEKLKKQVDNKQFMINKKQSEYDKLLNTNKDLEDRMSKLEKTEDVKKPNSDDYDDNDKYIDDLLEWKLKERNTNTINEKEIEKIVSREVINQKSLISREEIVNNFNQNAAKLSKKHEDYWDVVNSDTMKGIYSNSKNDIATVLEEHPNGAEIAYYLGNNLQIADNLTNVSPYNFMVKFSEIAEKVKPNHISGAPAPIVKSEGGSAILEKDVNKMSEDEYNQDFLNRKR